MRKISDALTHIIQNNQFLQFGLHHRLLNLSQVSRFIRPVVEARTQKPVQPAAITMALSRLQSSPDAAKVHDKKFALDNINIQTNLAVLTVGKDARTQRLVSALHARVKRHQGYITITEGLNEVTVILDADSLPAADDLTSHHVLFRKLDVAALTVRFSERYLKTPGFLFAIFQSLAFQGINIVEVASTTTELIVYLDHGDLELAFETLLHQFRKR